MEVLKFDFLFIHIIYQYAGGDGSFINQGVHIVDLLPVTYTVHIYIRYFFYLQKEMARDVIDSHSHISLISEKDFKTTPGRRKKW